MTKGRNIFIEGRLTFDSWTAQDGTKRSKHKVAVQGFQFVGDKRDTQAAKPKAEKPESTQGDQDDIPF